MYIVEQLDACALEAGRVMFFGIRVEGCSLSDREVSKNQFLVYIEYITVDSE